MGMLMVCPLSDFTLMPSLSMDTTRPTPSMRSPGLTDSDCPWPFGYSRIAWTPSKKTTPATRGSADATATLPEYCGLGN